jgi:hypothetical protein
VGLGAIFTVLGVLRYLVPHRQRRGVGASGSGYSTGWGAAGQASVMRLARELAFVLQVCHQGRSLALQAWVPWV